MASKTNAHNAAAQAIDLERLVAELGPSLIDLVAAPRGTAVPILDVALTVLNEPLAVTKDELVLAAGINPTTRRGQMLIGDLGLAGAAGVVFKMPGDAPADLLEAANAAGVAVLAVDPEIEWTQLYSF